MSLTKEKDLPFFITLEGILIIVLTIAAVSAHLK